MPTPVIEEPFGLSMINLYDSNLKTIWSRGCTDCEQDRIKAVAIIDKEFQVQGNTYVQWKKPKRIDLDSIVVNEDQEAEVEEEMEPKRTMMNAQNQQVPLEGLDFHGYYSETFVMYVVVGQSAALGTVMDEKLNDEISRGLYWFMGSLIVGLALFFVLFSSYFEKKLQVRITRPIQELSRQIKNPKQFMAERNKALDLFTRKQTLARNSSTRNTTYQATADHNSTVT